MEAQLRFEFSSADVVNVATVPQRSPFRYPGGKTWLVPTIRDVVQSLGFRPKVFIDPFAGGGIVPLTIAFENLAQRIIMGELDRQVASVWRTILAPGGARWLAERILAFRISRDAVVDVLHSRPKSVRELAFQTILRNRVQRGGIMAPGAGLVKNGENGRGVASRWYPTTLARRILDIAKLRERISFVEIDAFELCRKYSKRNSTVFFLDPPYTAGGKNAGVRLYNHNEVDHDALFALIAKVNGAAIFTYDDSDEVNRLARRHKFSVSVVAMKNTHHALMNELVILKGHF